MDSSSASTSSDEQSDELEKEDKQNQDFDSQFGEISSGEFSKRSYISFGEPVFSSNILVNQPVFYDPSVMASCQNFQSLNYPVFKKYGYIINGIYHSMAKKGATRARHNSLWRRGTPRLRTIKEEPELEDKQETKDQKKDKAPKVDDCNNCV